MDNVNDRQKKKEALPYDPIVHRIDTLGGWCAGYTVIVWALALGAYFLIFKV